MNTDNKKLWPLKPDCIDNHTSLRLVQANLALTYNSFRGNGWIGVGWDLDLGAIQRSTKFGIDYSANDFAAMDGSSSELVPQAEWGSRYYGAKIEGEFKKYYFNPETGGWEMTTRDGTRYFYGTTSTSRQESRVKA